MAVAVSGSNLGPYHSMGGVPQFVDVCGNDRLHETWPPKGGLNLSCISVISRGSMSKMSHIRYFYGSLLNANVSVAIIYSCLILYFLLTTVSTGSFPVSRSFTVSC